MKRKKVINSSFFIGLRTKISSLRNKIDPYCRIKNLENAYDAFCRNFYYEISDLTRNIPPVMGPLDTLQLIREKKLSFYRYGDGEFEMVAAKNMSFQKYDEKLCTRLREILSAPLDSGLCGLPNIYGSLAHFKGAVQSYWRSVALWSAPLCEEYCSKNAFYGDACVSRPSVRAWSDEALVPRVFDEWKALFLNQDILIVEGRYSRLGIGNDLLSGAKSIERIWCPPTDAWEHYHEILKTTLQHASNKLVLIALGATATVLAYDLCRAGHWAIDVGHVDLEYIWMNMGVTKKVAIPGRYVNEVPIGGREMIKVPREEKEHHVVATIGD